MTTNNSCPLENAYSGQKPNSKNIFNPIEEECGKNPQCSERKNLFKLLNDPILAKLILDETAPDDEISMAEGKNLLKAPDEAKGLGWMPIESTIETGTYKPYLEEDAVEAVFDPSRGVRTRRKKRKFVKFLIVKRYTAVENKVIYDTLSNYKNKPGENILFDKY